MNQAQGLAAGQRRLRSVLKERLVVGVEIQHHAGSALGIQEAAIEQRCLSFRPLMRCPLLERQLDQSPRALGDATVDWEPAR